MYASLRVHPAKNAAETLVFGQRTKSRVFRFREELLDQPRHRVGRRDSLHINADGAPTRHSDERQIAGVREVELKPA